MELMQYVGIVRRWAWLLLLGLVLGCIAGYLYSITQTPIYETSTKLMVGGSQQTGGQYDYMSAYNAQQLALTYVELLKTKPLLDSVSQRVGYPIGTVSAQLMNNTQIIQIQVQDKNAAHAMEVANAVVTVMIGQNENLQAGRYTANETNLQAQIDQVQKQIATLQGSMTNISQQSVQQQIDQVQAQIAPLQEEKTKLDQDIAALKTQIAAITFPTAEQQQQINNKNKTIIEEQNRIEQIQPLLAQYQQVYTNLVVLGKAGQSGSESSIQLAQLQSTVNVYQQLYINLLNSLETVRLSRMQNTPTVNQIEPATVPTSPISPKPVTNTATAGAVGLMLAAGIVFLVEYLDDTVKTPEQVEEALGLTILGYVADVPKVKGEDRGLYVHTQPRSPLAEAFRAMRTNLEYSGVDHPIRTLLVTSAGPGEGKSTVAANLAAILGQSGKPVALVDADLRRPSAHRFFNLENRVGITDAFKDHLDLEAVSQAWEGDENIAIITTGSLPPNPTELLASERMTKMLEDLKTSRSMVIIDSPPSIVTDPQVLATKVDGVVIVAWPGHTQMNGLRATLEQMNRVGANVIGIIFNRIPQNRGSYYGGYKHYSQYYYRNYHYNNYGYNADHGSEKKTNK